ncbi:hypothetical protein SARC_02294 [Sphaeroforma arctica JP610]|uniref:Uncharacterized protein n=1 Tax=Sphaeroforma arctica JP610 TaxID=667725 RepID=A0A0L0GBA3_9EUKA|nr:hypothetical protein SARC_02294 [Sphaeroforma arctica JP610]KNC85533.1 hypothetical protein SARC_02294 [Sphaeroforma arctica JP610]|eukprot:XP_014159435.1 hypothetical protein SARC_02294 [Sphaeroforma arctica JP610]
MTEYTIKWGDDAFATFEQYKIRVMGQENCDTGHKTAKHWTVVKDAKYGNVLRNDIHGEDRDGCEDPSDPTDVRNRNEITWWTEDVETKMMRAAYGDTRSYRWNLKVPNGTPSSEQKSFYVLWQIKTREGGGDRSLVMSLELRHEELIVSAGIRPKQPFDEDIALVALLQIWDKWVEVTIVIYFQDAGTGAILGEKELGNIDSWQSGDTDSVIRTGQYRRFQPEYAGRTMSTFIGDIHAYDYDVLLTPPKKCQCRIRRSMDMWPRISVCTWLLGADQLVGVCDVRHYGISWGRFQPVRQRLQRLTQRVHLNIVLHIVMVIHFNI